MNMGRTTQVLMGPLLGVTALPGAGQATTFGGRALPDRPGEREFVHDLAGMIMDQLIIPDFKNGEFSEMGNVG